MRAKSGASAAAKEGETVGTGKEGPAAAKTQTTVAGTGDKICCEAGATVASTGVEWGAVAALQQAILPPQPQSCATGRVGDTEAAITWPQRSIRLQTMVSAIFTL